MRRAGKGYAIENNIRNKNPQWMVVDPKQSLFNDDYYIDNGGSNAKWATLDSDTNVAGFAPGMDDIGHIILDNKKDVKFNRNLVTSHTHTVCVPYYKAAPYNISHTKNIFTGEIK